MVSRYGVSKEGAVGVAVGALGPMHCLLPHCGGPHHHHHLAASHPQNSQPGHNHHVHPGHQPPPPPSPSPHLNQLTHPQLTVNISHLGHHHHQHHQQQPQQQQQQPPQQQQQTQMPPQYRVTASRSEFHGNYSAQPGGQVGGSAASNVGVPTGRGPPPLGGIQTIGQSAAGIPPGGPAGGQAPSQAPTPGVQSQPPQGPAPTTTPPVHTPSPQEMGKQAHLQTQPPSLQQVYVPTQNRPASQGYYQTGPRPQQPRGISHRGGQGASGTPVVGMAGVGGGGGQPPAIYPHPAGLPVQASAMYIGQSQVHGLHTGPHQQSVYPINNQIPIHQFSGPPQRHQPHQNQSFYQTFQPPPIITPPNVFGYAHAPTPQHGYYYTASNTMSLTRASTSAVSGGAQHVAGPLAGTQGAPVVPQGTLQQPTQQAQPLPSMGIPLSQADVFSGHNGGATNTNNTTRSRKPRGQNAILDIVNPITGKNISDEIYKDNETTQSGESSNRETPQPQNNGAEVIADFAARVAKAATEGSDTVSTSASETAPNTIQTTAQTSLSNIQTNSANDANSQCSSSPPMTKNIAGAGASKTVPTINSQSLGTCSNATQIDSTATKTESKALQLPVKEFQPRSEIKSVTIEESSSVVSSVVAVTNKDTVSVQLTAPAASTETTAVTATVTIETESEAAGITGAVAIAGVAATGTGSGLEATKHLNASSNVVQTPVAPYWSNVTQEIPKPSATASSANPVPTKEPFPNLSKTSSNSPPRRKPNVTELPSSTKEQKERKTREKSLGSRGATPTPVHNQAAAAAAATADHHHQKTNGDAAGDKTEAAEVMHSRNEIQQKASDGKAMQKQKSKGKLKPRELNRKGAEKEGTDMDAFVNPVSAVKTAEIKQDNKEQHVPVPKDGNKEPGREVGKETKEKDNYESNKEKESLPVHAKAEKHASTEIASKDSAPVQQVSHVADQVPTSKDSSTKSEDSAFNTLPVASPNDVVDHAAVIEEIHLEALVAQKNEENFKVSALLASNDDKATTITSVMTEKKQDGEVSSASGNAPTEIATPSVNKTPLLKYMYKEGQWSPVNMSGRKSYDRDFLLRLQFDPNSKLKPANLPNLQAVLKDSLQNTHNTMEGLRAFKDANITRHDSLMPGFAKTNMSTRPPPTSRKSDRGKPKPNKPNVIHVSLSLREDVKLRETENAWKPARLKQSSLTEEEIKSEALYKRVRSVLNKLTPQKFNTLLEQVRHLPIDTQERLQGVINLVFEKAVDEPSFSVEYALLCKELAMMEVSDSDTQDSSVSFKKLIITRCQKEFEKNPIDDVARNRRIKEIDECSDSEKKKELQLALEEEERRIRIKSVGNIRFIGELYKQQILTTKIMHRCVRHLLEQNDEDNLECLCKLLTTIGKDLEVKGSVEEMQEYFNRMQEIVARKGHSKISSRIRFMLQDVIDLRANKWIPRRNENNPKTIDQIQKEAESERLDMQVNSAALNTARKDDRNNDRKRNRGLGGPTDDGWSQPVGRVRPATYSVETAKLKNKPPPMDDMQLGNRASYLWRATNPSNNSKTISSNKFACLENMSNLDQDKRMPPLQLSGSRSTGPRECSRDYKSYDGRGSRNGTHQSGSSSSRESHPLLDNSQSRNVSMLPPVLKSASQSGAISHKAPMSEQEFTKAYNSILKHYLEEPIVENTGLEIQQKFDSTTFAKLTRECINHVLEKSPIERELISKLLSHLLRQTILPVECFKNGLGEVLEIVDDLVIDIPKIWTYLAEILSHSIEDGAISLPELKSICISLRRQGFVGKFLGELMTKVSRNKGPKWLADKWDQSGLQLSNLIDSERENVDKIIQEYNLEFLTGDYNSAKDSAATEQLSLEKIQENLTRLMKENTSFDEICSWITANVGSREKDPNFIRHLMTAILETTLERHHGTWKLNLDTFASLQTLIQRFVDANELLELQCLYAIQRYIKKIEFPPGTLVPIMNRLWMDNVISSDAFLTWQKKIPEGPDVEGHSVSIVALTSFFTDLQEPDDNSSVEELSTSANQGC